MKSNIHPSETQTEWAKCVEDWRVSGMSMAAWCRQHGLAYSRFQYWKQKLSPTVNSRSNDSGHGFVQLVDPEPKPGISVTVGAYTIHLSDEFDEQALAKCARALRSA